MAGFAVVTTRETTRISAARAADPGLEGCLMRVSDGDSHDRIPAVEELLRRMSAAGVDSCSMPATTARRSRSVPSRPQHGIGRVREQHGDREGSRRSQRSAWGRAL